MFQTTNQWIIFRLTATWILINQRFGYFGWRKNIKKNHLLKVHQDQQGCLLAVAAVDFPLRLWWPWWRLQRPSLGIASQQLGYPLVMSTVCYGKWPLNAIEIVFFSIENGGSFHSYVKWPEGNWKKDEKVGKHQPEIPIAGDIPITYNRSMPMPVQITTGDAHSSHGSNCSLLTTIHTVDNTPFIGGWLLGNPLHSQPENCHWNSGFSHRKKGDFL